MVSYDGILLVSKPYGITSNDLVSNLKQSIGVHRIGHTGTLDPRATGLMVVCLGRATKIVQFLADIDKSYEAEIKLGVRSSTFDSEGIIDEEPRAVPPLNEKEISSILKEFTGKITQKVPAYSAVKVGGQRLYKLARKGKEIETPEREVEITKIALKKLELPVIGIEVTCSKGTYIRTLAHDIGERIGCGAYLHRLNRTMVGNFHLRDALTMNEIKYYRQAGTLKRYMRPIEEVLNFPVIKVNEQFAPLIISGKSPRLKDIAEVSGKFSPDQLISLMDHTGRIMAVGKCEISSTEIMEYKGKDFFTYVRVLN
ncbi:MAG: tRNA pseudouridine(55) synthase TruB [bacterium]|jgi:tRNA pseudouridine55 synthase